MTQDRKQQLPTKEFLEQQLKSAKAQMEQARSMFDRNAGMVLFLEEMIKREIYVVENTLATEQGAK